MKRSAARMVLIVLLAASAIGPATAADNGNDDSRLSSSTFAGLTLRGIGPALMSGRIADIAIHPDSRSIWYMAPSGTCPPTPWRPVARRIIDLGQLGLNQPTLP